MVGSDTMKLTGYPSIDRTHERMNSFFQNHPWIPNMSIVNAISLLSTFYKNSPALNCLDITLTYQELLSTSKVLAAALQELGIRKGDIITISMPNVSQAVALFLAANHIGAVTTFLNPGCSKEEVSFYLNLFASPLFINFDKEFDYNSSIKQNTSVRQIITLTKEDLHAKRFPVVKKTSLGYVDYIAYHDLQFLAEFSKGRLPLIQSGKQDALILFTSGSTGKPKSVVFGFWLLYEEYRKYSNKYRRKMLSLCTIFLSLWICYVSFDEFAMRKGSYFSTQFIWRKYFLFSSKEPCVFVWESCIIGINM